MKENIFNLMSQFSTEKTSDYRIMHCSVSPVTARILLQRNNGNRRINRATVAKYKRAILGGHWDGLNPLGIVIGAHGVIVDGQHRLIAIVESDISVECVFIFNEKIKGPRDAMIDQGCRRSTSFQMGIQRDLAAISSLAIRVTGAYGRLPNSNELSLVSEKIRPYIEYIPLSKAKLWGSAPMILSAVTAIHVTCDSSIKDQYRWLSGSADVSPWSGVETFHKMISRVYIGKTLPVGEYMLKDIGLKMYLVLTEKRSVSRLHSSDDDWYEFVNSIKSLIL